MRCGWFVVLRSVVYQEPSDPGPTVLAFLFLHQRAVHKHGKGWAFLHFLVSVDLIEAITGLDFFQGMGGEQEMESEDTWVNWEG